MVVVMALLLAPVERPGFVMRVVYRIARRRYGKVLMPLRVIYSRSPALLAVGLLIEWMREHATVLEPELRSLVTVYVSARRSCDFCADLAVALAVRAGIGRDRFDHLQTWRSSTAFSPRERAALAWVDDILDDARITPDTLAAAREVFSDRELVELTWLQASEAYFNLQAHPLGIASDELAGARRTTKR